MQIKMSRVKGIKFEATNERGNTAVMDGSPKFGGTDEGVRPMELLLMSLAGCSAIDVVLFLEKGRQGLEDLDVTVSGERADAVPAVFTTIDVHFTATGDVAPDKLERAVRMSMEKYCSVATMLRPTVEIRWSCSVG